MPDAANGKEAKMKKKVLALLVAAALTLGVCAPAFGASVTNGTDHDYDAYQVFKGTQPKADPALGDIDWGSGVDGDALLADLKSSETFGGLYEDCLTARDVANVLSRYEDKSPEAQAFANAAAGHLTEVKTPIDSGMTEVSLDAGYWLLVDTSNVDGKHDAKNPALLQVTGKENVSISKKYEVPSVEKSIIEGDADVKVSDASIGDEIMFKLTATMPSTFEGYESYKVVFHDTLSAGLAFKNGTVKVMLGDKDVTGAFKVSNESSSLTVACDNVLAEEVGASAGSSIVVTYKATLNSNAELGNPGNPNTVYLEYSNDPNWNGSGSEPTGKTPENKVVVFTYELDVTKVDGSNSNTKLEGAEFVLYRGQSSNLEYAKVTGGKVSGWTSSKDEASTLTSDSDGLFKIAGLDAGAYYLKETKAPAGYNLVEEPIEFVIEAELSNDKLVLTKLTIAVGSIVEDGDCDTGVVSMTVKNNKGPVLPETGGIGTTLFYAVGGLLVVGAVALLIIRRRAGSEE